MIKYKTKKLKTWEQFEEEFKPYSDEWITNDHGDVLVKYRNYYWYISHNTIEYFFGQEIKIHGNIKSGNIKYGNFTCFGSNDEHENNHCFHELWFEEEFKPIEFIKEEEFMV